MRKAIGVLLFATVAASCSTFGPPAVHLTRGDIAERAFIDRGRTDLRQLFGRFEGLDISGPDVGMQTQAQRLQLEWTIRAKQTPIPMSMAIAISGRAELNGNRTGIDLVDARIEQIRLPSIPFIGSGQLSQGEPLGRLPLLAFRPEELNRDGVIYEPTTLTVGAFGVRVDLSPK